MVLHASSLLCVLACVCAKGLHNLTSALQTVEGRCLGYDTFEHNCVMMCLYPCILKLGMIARLKLLYIHECACSNVRAYLCTAIVAMLCVPSFIHFLLVTLQSTELLKWSQHPVSMQKNSHVFGSSFDSL